MRSCRSKEIKTDRTARPQDRRTTGPQDNKQIKQNNIIKMKLTLKIWRQKNAGTKGNFETYQMDDVSPRMAFP